MKVQTIQIVSGLLHNEIEAVEKKMATLQMNMRTEPSAESRNYLLVLNKYHSELSDARKEITSKI